jgi:hypothetical protein
MGGAAWKPAAAPAGWGLERLPVLKDFLLIVRPDETWNRIVAAQRGVVFVWLIYLLPMLLLASVVEGHALMLIGRHQSAAGLTNQFPAARVYGFEVVQSLVLILLLLVAASFIQAFGNACHRRNHFTQSLLVLFHALGPLLLVQCLNGIPSLHVFWVSSLFGVALAISALYYGLPRIMQPDPSSALGLFLAGGFVIFLLLAADRLFTYLYLTGNLHWH